ncbi:hypothetical protein QWJ90_01330 [Microbacterium oryzae]|uniref:hypothetical protein n=1 Tax=Microbacterium oryzae TaxID=743009 RepID=UPI0025AF3896|nr:hypothetical protein [Microbacterium oryzae]MDN3309564.1 hypothetical protein [Microbacterium oryzae]
MQFAHGTTVYRLRPRMIDDPYSDEQTPGGWDEPDELPIDGAFIAQSSTSRVGTATRTQAIEAKSLYCDPAADVQPGDRIRADGEVFTVDGFPAADTNPFTGWQPVMEVPLTRALG